MTTRSTVKDDTVECKERIHSCLEKTQESVQGTNLQEISFQWRTPFKCESLTCRLNLGYTHNIELEKNPSMMERRWPNYLMQFRHKISVSYPVEHIYADNKALQLRLYKIGVFNKPVGSYLNGFQCGQLVFNRTCPWYGYSQYFGLKKRLKNLLLLLDNYYWRIKQKLQVFLVHKLLWHPSV